MELEPQVKDAIAAHIQANDMVVFMKGTRSMPQCGFSATVVQLLNELGQPYETVNVLADPEIRDGIKIYSNWPTIPQLYVKGEFIGGCDIVKDLFASGQLHRKLGVEYVEPMPPTVTLTEAAATAIRAAMGDTEQEPVLHFGVNARFEASLQFGAPDANMFSCESNGLTIVVDRDSAARADGVTIDFVDDDEGKGFRIDNPNQPSAVIQVRPADVKAKLDAGESFVFVDVRTADERSQAVIAGTRLLDPSLMDELKAMSKETAIVFHCHHGGRSQKLAEEFCQQGFSQVHNMQGGIEAWATDVDSKVPRY